MDNLETKRFEMFIRVREFGAEDAAKFPPASFAGQRFATINEAIEGLETHAAAQDSGRRKSKQSVMGKSAARDELLRDLEAISRTARSMALSIPGLEDKFRVPRRVGDQALLTAARAIAADALPLKNQFIERGHPADFLQDLDADISLLETSITEKIQGTEAHVEATAAIDELIERGMRAVRELDPVMRNVFAAQPARLAAWLSASHVERPPKTQKKKEKTAKIKAEDKTSAPAQP